MPGIFSPDNIPQWMNPVRNILEEDATQMGQNFASGFRQAQSEKNQKDLIDFRVNEQQKIAQKATNIAGAFQGADTPEKAWTVASNHPEWLADPQTAPFVKDYLKTQTDVARAQVNSLEGKTKIADITDFTKRISTIDPEDRAAIKGMNANPDGSISSMQWQALGLAEQRMKVAAENTRTAAEMAAIGRGDVATTKITDKGVETTFKPAPLNSNASPLTKELGGGITVAWMPGGKTLHVIKPSGEKNELTPSQLENIAKGLDENGDPRGKQILEFLATKAVETVQKKSPAPVTTTPVPTVSTNKPSMLPQNVRKYNPQTGRIE